jgi:predicted permease
MDALGNCRTVLRRLGARLRRGRLEADLAEEICQHLESRTRALVDEGMDPGDAAYEARRGFGNPSVIREEARDMWSYRWLDALAQDTRFAGRVLRRFPLVTAVAILSLAVGIGSASTVFTVAHAALFRPLDGVRAASELRAFQIEARVGGASKIVSGVPPDAFDDVRHAADFAEFVGFRTADSTEIAGSGPGSVLSRVTFVSPNYFEVLGATPTRGRLIRSTDAAAGTPLPLVISEALWRSGFSAADDIVGRTVSVNGSPAVVLGVVKAFRGMVADRPSDVFAPLDASERIDPSQAQFGVTLAARLKPGMPPAVAEAKLASIYRVAMPGMTRGAEVRATLKDASGGIALSREALRLPLQLGLALVAVLMVIACANTGALLLSHFIDRRGELALRLAIGADRLRVSLQMSVEALLIGFWAAVIGSVFAWIGAPVLLRVLSQSGAQSTFDVRLDAQVLLFTIAIAAAGSLGALAASLLSLWRSEPVLTTARESHAQVRTSGRLTMALVGAQVACTLLLLVGAAAMGRTIVNLRQVPLGFDSAHLVFVSVNAAGLASQGAMSSYHAGLHERLAALPGVERAALAQLGLLTSATTIGTVDVPGFTPATDEDRVSRIFFVDAGYFDTLRMPLVAGRAFLPHEMRNVSVVNEQFARRYFGSPAQAIGRLYNRDVRIVGVVADAHYSTLRGDPGSRAAFVHYAPLQRAGMTHIVRLTGVQSGMTEAVRAAVLAHDSRLRPVISTGEDLIASSLARERFFAVIATTLALLAMLLSCGGLWATVGYAVSRRTSELAIRRALGASRRSILALMLRGPVRTVITGLIAGTPAVFLVMRSARALLFGIPSFDLVIVGASAGLLLTIGVAAALWPAYRATTIDPITVLKNN